MSSSTVTAASPAPPVGLPVPVERDDETSTWLIGELTRDFPAVDRPLLATAADTALAEFADATIRLYVHVLALRIARDFVRAATGAQPLARSLPTA